MKHSAVAVHWGFGCFEGFRVDRFRAWGGMPACFT